MEAEYTVRTLSRLAGVSPRTLRHYDALGLLRPSGTKPSGYRVYGPAGLERLQRILFYRELGLPLEEIRKALGAPGYDDLAALRAHRATLLERWRRVESLVDQHGIGFLLRLAGRLAYDLVERAGKTAGRSVSAVQRGIQHAGAPVGAQN